MVKYYYKVYNQQITKIINFRILNCLFILNLKNRITLILLNIITIYPTTVVSNEDTQVSRIRSNNLLRVGISETIRTQQKIINNFKIPLRIVEFYSIKSLSYLNGQRRLNTLSRPFFAALIGNGAWDHRIELSTLINNEIVKDNHNNEISLKFKEWFAGITDGDGYIYVKKEGYVGFEMTLPSHDEKVLRIIQNKFGGSIKARAGIKAIRYRSQHKITVTKIIQCLNGLLINNIRLVQLHKACLALNIPIKEPVKPTLESAYISGLLDSDGTINFYKHRYKDTFRYQLTISIANKSRSNIEFLLDVIGGNIYFDKSENGFYFWKANSKLLHFKLYDYFIKFPPKTIKGHRTHLIKEFHELNELKAYRENEDLAVNFKRWKIFLDK